MQEQKVSSMFIMLGGLCGAGLALVGILIGNTIANATGGEHVAEHPQEQHAEH
jgi:hypothetical protein